MMPKIDGVLEVFDSVRDGGTLLDADSMDNLLRNNALRSHRLIG